MANENDRIFEQFSRSFMYIKNNIEQANCLVGCHKLLFVSKKHIRHDSSRSEVQRSTF